MMSDIRITKAELKKKKISKKPSLIIVYFYNEMWDTHSPVISLIKTAENISKPFLKIFCAFIADNILTIYLKF